MVADSTPGIAASFSFSAFQNCCNFFASFVYTLLVSEICAVSRPSGRMPGLTCWSFQNARTSRPEPISSTRARDNSAVTSAARKRFARTDPEDRPPAPLSASLTGWLNA